MRTQAFIVFLLIAFLLSAISSSSAMLTQQNPDTACCIESITLWAVDNQGAPPPCEQGDLYQGNWNETLTGCYTGNYGIVHLKGEFGVRPSKHESTPVTRQYSIVVEIRHLCPETAFTTVYSDQRSLGDIETDLFNNLQDEILTYNDYDCDPNIPNKEGMIGEIRVTITQLGRCSCSFISTFLIAYYAGGFRAIFLSAQPSQTTRPGSVQISLLYTSSQWLPDHSCEIEAVRCTQYNYGVSINTLLGRHNVTGKVSDRCGTSYGSTHFDVCP